MRASVARWPESGLPDRLYVVQDSATKYTVPGPNSWTVSPDPELPGWETDGGEEGYGLPLEVAQEIVRRYNQGPVAGPGASTPVGGKVPGDLG